MAKNLRVGVLTGGGDCPGLNAVIRAVAKSLMVRCNAEVIGIMDGYEGLIEQRVRTLRRRDVSGLLTLGGTILGTSNKANPFRYHDRGNADVSDDVVAYYNELGLDAVVAIGGDGTQSVSHELSLKGMNIVGVPKTIDNDLMATDRTFGFDTAVNVAAEAIDRLHTTAQSHHRVMILETMGRYAGWIALYAGVAGGADIILIPEWEYDLNEVVKVCKRREEGGQNFTIIAVAEGARESGGSLVVRDVVDESPDPIRLGGIGRVLEKSLEGMISSEVRTAVLGHIQRGGSPSPYDRTLATAFGAYASAMVEEGNFNRMVALQNGRITSVPLAEVAGKVRTVPRNAPMVGAALAVGTSFGVPDIPFPFDGKSPSVVLT